jgi:hypothetical protein
MLKGALFRKLFKKGGDEMAKPILEPKAEPRPRPEMEKRPTWTMDVMILSNLNEISKAIDEAAMQVETGNLNSMIIWKAGLRQFYRNIKSFCDPSIDSISTNSFNQLDVLINMAQQTLPSNEKDINLTINLLANMNEMLYHLRNELFMRLVDIISPTRKAYGYAFDALPDKDKEQRIQDAEKKQEDQEAEKEYKQKIEAAKKEYEQKIGGVKPDGAQNT